MTTHLMTTQKLPSPLIGYRTSRVKYRFESFSHIQTVYDNKRRAGSPSNPHLSGRHTIRHSITTTAMADPGTAIGRHLDEFQQGETFAMLHIGHMRRFCICLGCIAISPRAFARL